MAMDVFTALGLVGLGGLLGAAGQGARVIVGLKKDLQAAAQDPRVRELAEREEELHRKISGLVDKERQLDKEAEAPQDNASKPELEREKIARAKELLLKEKEMILSQRRARGWFESGELLVSLMIAFVVGAIAGILAGVQMLNAEVKEITQGAMLTIILAGYAGTDFIEGFIRQRLPK